MSTESSRVGVSSGGARRRDIQGLRAVAVLGVVLYHAGGLLPGGFAGVDVFFVISGFVITGVLLRDHAQHGRVRFVRFYARRVARLLPALALVVSFVLAASVLLLSPYGPQRLAGESGRGAMLLVANEVIRRNVGGYFDVRAEADPLLHTWSLSVEEQFYLIFPAVMALALSTGRSRSRRVARVAIALGVAVSLGVVLVAALPLAPSRLTHLLALLGGFYSPFARVWEFGAGALVALLPTAPRSRELELSGAAALALGLVAGDGGLRWPGPVTLLPVAGTATLLATGAHDLPISRLMSGRALVAVGNWSYSIYLWHWPLIVWAGALWPRTAFAQPLAALLSVVPAVISYRYVEQPLRARRWRGWAAPSGLAAGLVAVPVALSVVLMTGTSHLWWSPKLRDLATTMQPMHIGRKAGCHAMRAITPTSTSRCTFNPRAGGPPVYLVGDSHADQLSDPVVRAGAELHRPVHVATASGCPVAGVGVVPAKPVTPTWTTDCRRFVDGTLAALARAPRGLVVIANTDVYWRADGYEVAAPGGEPVGEVQARERAFAAGLTQTVARLRAAGHEVLVVQTTPQWVGPNAWEPMECPVIAILTGRCRAEMTTASAEETQGAVREIVARGVAAKGGRVLDLWPVLCPGGYCETQRNGKNLYRDSGHVSVDEAEALTPTVRRAMASRG